MPDAAAPPTVPDDGVDPGLVDAGLALAMALAVAVVVAADLQGSERSAPLAYLFAVGFGGLVLARRRAPRLVLGLTILGVFLYYIFEFPPIGIALPAVAALYSAAELGHARWAVGGGALLTGTAAFFRIEEGLPGTYLASYEFLTNVTLVAAAVALGVSVRARRETREHQARLRTLAAAEQQRQAEALVNSERVRIARDLHDLVGHTMSVVAVHANVAAEAVGRDDDAARSAVERISEATATAMRDLRTTVKLLRAPAADEAERGTVGLAGLDRLAQIAADAGVAVEVDVDVADGSLDGAVDAAAYRIVQEAVTNVIRHAGAGRAHVDARVRDGRLHVTVTDDGRGSGGEPARTGGQGIAGMTERAALLGGTLVARDGEHGGFVVHAELPAKLPS